MAEDKNDQSQERTEEPSSKRREEFRADGNVASSPEVTALISLGAGTALLSTLGIGMWYGAMHGLQGALNFGDPAGLSQAVSWAQVYVSPVLRIVSLFLVIMFIVVAFSAVAQTQFNFSWKAISPKWSRVNPLQGAKRFFSVKMLIQLLKNLIKLGFIGWIAYGLLRTHISEILMASNMKLQTGMVWGVRIIGSLVARVCIFMAAVAVLDYIYQWYSTNKQMRMTMQEVKEERKNTELPSHVRNKIRQVQNERSKRIIQKEVPNADVVITNPTHFAVAIRYSRETDQAPRVVAKGADHMAALIRQLARDNDVALYEYPELARTLYRRVKVGQMIPAELYESVARILAYIYQLHNREYGAGKQAHV